MGACAGIAGHNLGGCHHRPLSEKTKAGDGDEQSSEPSEPGGAAKNQRFGTKLFTDRRKMRPMLLVQQFDLRQNYTLLEQKGVISSIIDEIIKLRKT